MSLQTDGDDLTEADYSKASLPCDILMKGGVTSGVVYPLAICRLAQTYTFQNIGGTSAGAIASALAAAAEYSRRFGRDGFKKLASLSDYLATGDNLVNLFQPSRPTRALFRTLLVATHGKPALWKIVGTAVLSCWLPASGAVLVVLGGSSIILAGLRGKPLLFAYATALALVFAVLGAVVAVVWRMWQTLRMDLPGNFFGMCTGLSAPGADPAALTPWLAAQINDYADPGLRHPLTFGDLWDAPRRGVVASDDACLADADVAEPRFASPHIAMQTARANRSIHLEMVTTNVTIGRPYSLPFNDLEELLFYFEPGEFRKLFPKTVVAHLVSHPPAGFGPRTYAPGNAKPSVQILPLPAARLFPVIVAARMSLSFPLLFSAVPLYAVSRFEPGTPVIKCWFSDGGISSNLPIQFFDNPLSRWPTFALNLRNPVPQADGPGPVAMADQNEPDVNQIAVEGTSALPGFLLAILDSMQNWVDNTQLRLPGYRERVVEIQLDPTEGGLNLQMTHEMRKALQDLGSDAGDLLVKTFAPLRSSPAPGWTKHRVIRLRTVLAVASEWLRAYLVGAAPPVPPDESYSELLGGPMAGYPWNGDAQRRSAKRLFDELIALGRYVRGLSSQDDPTAGAPVPGPELKPRPRQ